MSDFMIWLYLHYIKPYLDTVPADDYNFHMDMIHNELGYHALESYEKTWSSPPSTLSCWACAPAGPAPGVIHRPMPSSPRMASSLARIRAFWGPLVQMVVPQQVQNRVHHQIAQLPPFWRGRTPWPGPPHAPWRSPCPPGAPGRCPGPRPPVRAAPRAEGRTPESSARP